MTKAWSHLDESPDDRAKKPLHLARFCEVQKGDYFWSGKQSAHCGQWVPRYTCPECGRQMRMPSNYLGDGQLVCTGNQFWKPHEQTRSKLGDENIRSLIKA